MSCPHTGNLIEYKFSDRPSHWECVDCYTAVPAPTGPVARVLTLSGEGDAPTPIVWT